MSYLSKKNKEFQLLKTENLAMGGNELVAKQKEQGKLNVRERIHILFDSGSFQEFGLLANHDSNDPSMKGKSAPADGVICGLGRIDGRQVVLIAYDFTVIAGTIGEVGERKCQRMREIAMDCKIPIVWLLDSAGARVQEIASSRFAETGGMFFDQVQLSGFVPQVGAVMGPCAAGTAYIPALTDFVPMVKGSSSMALAGPPLVKAAIGEEISVEDLGGSQVHCKVSGVADYEAKNDKECLETIRKYLSFFPSHCGEKAPVKKSYDEYSALREEMFQSEDIYEILPDSSMKPYDMKKVIHKITDPGETLEIKAQFAPSMITCLSRIDGRPIGILANQPLVNGGVIDSNASDKAARFINLCDSFNIPLLYLVDVPGFMVGSKVEKEGIIRHGAKMLFATSQATVPKMTVIIRKAYGAGYYVMCGKGYRPDLIVAWPSAEISLMGASGAVNILFRKEIKEADDPDSKRKELEALYEQRVNLNIAARGAYIDDVIDPKDTRQILINTLERCEKKSLVVVPKKRSVMPV